MSVKLVFFNSSRLNSERWFDRHLCHKAVVHSYIANFVGIFDKLKPRFLLRKVFVLFGSIMCLAALREWVGLVYDGPRVHVLQLTEQSWRC